MSSIQNRLGIVALIVLLGLFSGTDAFPAEWTYTYDNMDRLKTRTDPLGRTETYAYDLMGNLTQVTDRKGQITTYTYDALNRPVRAQYADSSSVSFIYDVVGRLTLATDSISGTIQFTYDNLDRLVLEVAPLGTVAYKYDAIGRRTSMIVAGQVPVTYTYDAASRLTQVAQGDQLVGLGYDAANRRTSLTYPNGTVTSYAYDAASHVIGITHTSGASVIESMSYQYDAGGNRISVIRNNGAATVLPSSALARYDDSNQQTWFDSSTPNLTYDANGNLVSKTDASGTTTYTWDARNRLTAINGPGLSSGFVYDALNRRTSKTVNGITTQYLYDGLDVIAEINGGAVSATYLRSLNIDEPFVRYGASAEFYHADALGSTLVLTDNAGSVRTIYHYDPFGNTMFTGALTANPFQFTGRENDGTGLYYYRARYYSATLQRFISEDPLRLQGGDINLYAYVKNSPVNYLDPYGLKIIYENGSTVSDPRTVQKLEALDQAVGDRDVRITSGDRTPSQNDRVRGASQSYHLEGKAADVIVNGLTPEQVAEKAAAVGFDGIITYDPAHKGHTHVDTRGVEFNGHNGNRLPNRPTWRVEGEKQGGRKPIGGRK